MPVYNYDLIFLGNAADIDLDETDLQAEDAANLLGTYGTAGDPLRNHIVSASIDDADGDSNINTDNDFFGSSETVTIDGVPNVMDSGVVYGATITYTDGTTATISAVIMQTTGGDLYLFPEISNNADTAALEAKPIESLTLNNVQADTTTIAADRYQTNFLCFAEGSRILTASGPRAIETLRPGDMLWTMDRGLQPLRWVGSRTLQLGIQMLFPQCRAVRLARGCLAPGIPERDLILSAQHRVVLASRIVDRMFGSEAILTAAKNLARGHLEGVTRILRPLRLYHLALDRHEILLAEGAAVESLFDGPQTGKLLGPAARDAWARSVGRDSLPAGQMTLARPVGARARVDRCLSRHRQNNKPLFTTGAEVWQGSAQMTGDARAH